MLMLESQPETVPILEKSPNSPGSKYSMNILLLDNMALSLSRSIHLQPIN
ncbi:hypothetical protein DSUL_20177 [Desulfovibrionales bacterium]